MITALFIILALLAPVLCLIEVKTRPGPKSRPLEDLRTAYAPDLIQVFRDQDAYREKQKLEGLMEQTRYNKEQVERFHSQLQDAKIKRWLEGNPVTDENPLTEKERPPQPYYMGSGNVYYSGPYYP